jgi:predicted Ser/Thr protein kinase
LLQAGLESQASAPESPTQTSPHGPAGSFVPPSPAELASRFPQLEILELLGKGGMGAVYKARQPGLDRLVAVKILPPEISGEPMFTERFSREARALARLSHPNIVAVYDFGQAEGQCYFVMEYVDGVNLRQAIQSGGLTVKDALTIVPQICDALQFAHDEGVVHRDVKPENVLVDKRGRVKIADFGLAKLFGQDKIEHSLTGTHQVMGTLRYMAPEQIEGTRSVDHRADIYSLGVVFYELLTGELPLGRFAPPSKKVQLDIRLDDVVLRALEKEPEQRYQHASEIKSEVDAIRGSQNPLPMAAVNAAPIELPPVVAPNMPGIVRAAGIIWILFGTLSVALGSLMLLVLSVKPSAIQPVHLELFSLVVSPEIFALGSVVFGVGFIVAGTKTLRGTVADTLENGLGSIFFGILFGGIAFNTAGGPVGFGFVVAGILALVGRLEYKAWRTLRLAAGQSQAALLSKGPRKLRPRDLPMNRRWRFYREQGLLTVLFMALIAAGLVLVPLRDTNTWHSRYVPKSKAFERLELTYQFTDISWMPVRSVFHEQPSRWNLGIIFHRADSREPNLAVLLPGLEASYMATWNRQPPVEVTKVLDREEFRDWATHEAGLDLTNAALSDEVDQIYQLLKRYKDGTPEGQASFLKVTEQILSAYDFGGWTSDGKFLSSGFLWWAAMISLGYCGANRWLWRRAAHRAQIDGLLPADRQIPAFHRIPALAAMDMGIAALGLVLLGLGVQYCIDRSEYLRKAPVVNVASDAKQATGSEKPAVENPASKPEAAPAPQANAAEALGFYQMGAVALEAFDKGDLKTAELLANEYLKTAAKYQKDWNYGNAIFTGNTLLGRIAVTKGDLSAAKGYLLAAGKTPGSPQLNSFGPDFKLAAELLARGERQTVLEYLAECTVFWKLAPEKLARFAKMIEDGQTPDELRVASPKSPFLGTWLSEDAMDAHMHARKALDFLPDGSCTISTYMKGTVPFRVIDSTLITENTKGKDDPPTPFELRGDALTIKVLGKDRVFRRPLGETEVQSLRGKWIETTHVEDAGDATVVQTFDGSDSGTLTLEMRTPLLAPITYQLVGEMLTYALAGTPDVKLSATCTVNGDTLTLTNFFLQEGDKPQVYHRAGDSLPSLFRMDSER